MKVNNIKLNKKNFWIPFLLFSGISFLIFLFTISLLVSDFNLQTVWIIILTSLPSSILPLIIISIPPFFIIKRLLTKKPKKVFYFELPILIIIYSFIGAANVFIGLMFGGPINTGLKNTLILMLYPIIFTTIWILLLTVSLYFYYKKFVTNK